MKLSEIRRISKLKLKGNGIEELDADFIIAEILSVSVTSLFQDRDIDNTIIKEISNCIERRAKHIPIEKIFNKAYFYGLEFYVDNNVLTPRSETELLVDKALEFINQNKNVKVLDLCTGSGAIACAIKKHCGAEIDAVDISNKAIKIAKKNAKNLNLDINIFKSDMFSNLKEKYDLIISNPPYIETEVCTTLESEVKDNDPILALDGGEDGLDFYRVIKANLNYLKPNGVLIMEIGYNQGESVKEIFNDYDVKIVKDYNNLDRVVIVKEKTNGR